MGNVVKKSSDTPNNENNCMTMSFFRRKQNKEGHKRLQYQLYTAKHAPDSVVDVSSCDLSQIPPGLYALVKVLLKQVLLLHNNRLPNLKEAGTYEEFAKTQQTLRVIDAHDNELREIPSQLRFFTKLQVLNVEGNRVTSIPDEIGHLTSLQTLNVKNNQLQELPESIGGCTSLRTLDISENQIIRLPQSLTKVKCLETLLLDAELMVYPPPDVCKQGTQAIMQFLCREAGVDYQAPSRGVLPLLNDPKEITAQLRTRCHSEAHISQKLATTEGHLGYLADTALQYERNKREKLKEKAKIQQAMLESRAQHAAVVAHNVNTRQRLLGNIVQQNETFDKRLWDVQLQKEIEKQEILASIGDMEKHAQTLIKQILVTNREVLWAEERLEEEERRRMQEEQWYKVKFEEYQRLRKAEIEKSMSLTIAQNYSLDELRQFHEKLKGKTLAQMIKDETVQADTVDAALRHKDNMMKEFMRQMLHDQKFQKEAVLALMEQRDTRTNRLNSQIDMIHKELAQLSLLERKNTDMRLANEQECLEDERLQLTRLLMQLMNEKEGRSRELQKRLTEMEKAQEDSQLDYWLIQYQKLLDSKPQPLIDRERQLDVDVCKILEKAGANDFIPAFARHNITDDVLPTLSEEDLQKMGIYQVGLRKAILKAIETLMEAKKVAIPFEKGAQKTPPKPETSQERRPSAPPMPARFELECVVCMETNVNLLFVPCGHVCCCLNCGQLLKSCPLCRGEIKQKINLESTGAPSGET